MSKRIIAATAALTIGLVGFGSAAAFADEGAPSSDVTTPAITATSPSSTPATTAPTTSTTTETPASQPSPTPSVEPSPPTEQSPASPPESATPSPTTAPTPAEPAPVVTTPAPAPIYTVVLWEIDASGDTHLPQKYIGHVTTTTVPADLTSLFTGQLKCGIKYQIDAYLPHDGVEPSTLWVTGYLLDGHDGAFLAYSLPFTPYVVLTTDTCPVVTPPVEPPVVTPPVVTPPVVTPPVVTPPVVTPPVVTPPTTVPPTDKPTPPAKPVVKPAPVVIHTAIDRQPTATTATVAAKSDLAYTGSRDMRAAAEAAVVTLIIGILLMVGAGIARHRRNNV